MDDVLDHIRALHISGDSLRPIFILLVSLHYFSLIRTDYVFRLPFYTEFKTVFLLYLVAPATRGSGVIYRRWVHPLLCDKVRYMYRMIKHRVMLSPRLCHLVKD